MKLVLVCFLLVQLVTSQVQVWYQKQTGTIGPAMSVAVSSQGVIYASVYNKGIYRSLDTGGTWVQTAPYTDGVWSLALRNSGEIVAALWTKGVFRSTDNGGSWTETTTHKPFADVRAISAQDEIIIEAEGTLFRSPDNGAEWKETSVGGTSVAVSGDTIYAAKGTSVFRSIDQGVNWSMLTSLSSASYSLLVEQSGALMSGGYCSDTSSAPSIHTFDTLTQTWNSSGPRSTINALLQRRDGMIFAASHDSGFYYLLDHGASWRQHNNGLSTSKIYSLALLNDTTIIAGTLDGIFFINSRLSAPLPVELTSFTVSVRNSIVELRWRTATELNNHGFDVERKKISTVPGEQSEEWSSRSFVPGYGSSNAPHEYSYADRVTSGGTYAYRLKQIDRDGRYSYSQSIEVTAVTGPRRFILEQNYPNPFNPSTAILYTIPSSGHVSLIVYDLIGREVSHLVNAVQNAGSHSVTLDAASLSSGVYLYSLRSGNYSATKRMVLVR